MKASRPTAVHSKTEIIDVANVIRVTGILEIIEIVCLAFFHPALFNRSVKIINDCLAPFFFLADAIHRQRIMNIPVNPFAIEPEIPIFDHRKYLHVVLRKFFFPSIFPL